MNTSPILAPLTKRHFGVLVPTTNIIHIEETQHENYLGIIIVNKLSTYQKTDDLCKKAANLLNLQLSSETVM